MCPSRAREHDRFQHERGVKTVLPEVTMANYLIDCPSCGTETTLKGAVTHLVYHGKLQKRLLLCPECARLLLIGTKRQQGRIRASLLRYLKEHGND